MSRGDPTGSIRGEFLEAYLGEVDELLNGANGLLLAIDAPQRKREPTPRQIRDLFRAMHTVKGLSAMVGVEPVVSLAHRAEALLRSADRSGGLLRPGAVDLLLQAVRAIEQRVRALGQQKPVSAAPAALLDALDAFEEGVAFEPRAAPTSIVLDPALDAKLAPFERQSLARGVSEGKRVVCVRFAPSPALAAEGVTINSVRERLGSIAEIVKVVPVSVPRSEGAPAGLSFVLLVITPEGDAGIAACIGLDPSAIECLAEGTGPTRAVEPEAHELASTPDDEIADEDVVHRNFVRVDVDRLDDTITELAQLAVSRAALVREVAKLAAKGVDVRELNAVIRDQDRKAKGLRAAILRLRMIPVSEVFERVPLIVRGLRRSTGKSVRVELDAGQAELDKAVADRIFPVIVHLVRNAVDHAIEAPDARVSAGKPTEGLVRISCRSRGNAQLEVQVTDDGAGVNAGELARRAGVPLPTTNAGLLQLLCRPGLSIRDEVTVTSGRGMGMDIVRKVVVDQLGGEVTLETTPGVGTTFALRVPLTISIVDAFAFECGAQRFLVPLSTVDAIVEIDPAALVSPPGRGGLELLSRRGESLPLVRLDVLFGLADPDAIRTRPKAMIVRREELALAFAFDRMLGQMEIVVRPLTDPLVNMRGIAGAADLGDGQPTLVVDLYALGARLAETATPDRAMPA